MNYIDRALRKIETKAIRHRLEKNENRNLQLNTKPRDKKIIVSLTSYPARFQDLHLVIKSIFTQTVLPDQIILYLDEGVEDSQIPNSLKDLESYGLSIIVGGADIKPHKKYYYAMKDNPESIIITVDDDNMYRPDTIEKLMNSYRKYPEAVSCLRAHRIIFDNNQKLLPYMSWDLVCTDIINTPSLELLATGVGGVLYPPNCMNEELFNLDNIKNLCLGADDIWLKYMQLLSGTKVVAVERKKRLANPLPADTKGVSALAVGNVLQSANDRYIDNLEQYYKKSFYELIKK